MSAFNIPPEEKAYQLAHPNESSVPGLGTWNIVGLCIVEVAVVLRLWGRKIQKVPFKADDYTLIVAAILVIGHCVCIAINLKCGFGHHTLTISPSQTRTRGRVGYAYSFFYQTTFPISRISLVLLYKRIFNVKIWFRYVCWFLVACYVGYILAWIPCVAVGTLPVNSLWNKSVKPTHTIDARKLQLANCSFNIATDAILLVMPLAVIWTLHMSTAHKVGVSAVFCLGVLTVIASIMRCYYTFHSSNYDPLYDQGRTGYWTVTEVYLGILCPCIVTFGPLVYGSYRFVTSYLTPKNRHKMDKLTGIDGSENTGYSTGKKGTDSASPYPTLNRDDDDPILLSERSDLESRRHHNGSDDESPSPPNFSVSGSTEKANKWHHFSRPRRASGPQNGPDGMAPNQAVALANLDPRSQAQDLGHGKTHKLGSSAQVEVADDDELKVPQSGIGVKQAWDVGTETNHRS